MNHICPDYVVLGKSIPHQPALTQKESYNFDENACFNITTRTQDIIKNNSLGLLPMHLSSYSLTCVLVYYDMCICCESAFQIYRLAIHMFLYYIFLSGNRNS